jgi:hypothetical protein
MLAIVPVTVKSAPLLGPLTRLFEKLGSQGQHRLLISCDSNVLEEAQQFAESVKRLFVDVSVFSAGIIDATQAGRTTHLRETLAYMVQNKNRDPWIWMEHACPTNPDWLDQLQQEWDLKPVDRHVLGCVEPTYYRATPAQQKSSGVTKPLFSPKGHHVRFGVYSYDFVDRVTLLRSTGSNTPWELHCQNEIVPMTHPSSRLATLWASRNFDTKGKARVEGEQTPGVESEIRAKSKKAVDLDEVSVVHGCRDGSLEWIVSRRTFKPKTAEEKLAAVQENITEAKEVVNEYAEKIRAQEAELQTLRVRVRELEGQVTYYEQQETRAAEATEDAPEEEVDLDDEEVEFEGELSAAPLDEEQEEIPAKKLTFAPVAAE